MLAFAAERVRALRIARPASGPAFSWSGLPGCSRNRYCSGAGNISAPDSLDGGYIIYLHLMLASWKAEDCTDPAVGLNAISRLCRVCNPWHQPKRIRHSQADVDYWSCLSRFAGCLPVTAARARRCQLPSLRPGPLPGQPLRATSARCPPFSRPHQRLPCRQAQHRRRRRLLGCRCCPKRRCRLPRRQVYRPRLPSLWE